MKYKYLILGLILLSAIVFFTFYPEQAIVGPHGGVVKSAENYNIESTAPYPKIYTFLLDKKFEPVSNKGLFCEVRLFPPDGIPIDLQLKPSGADGFEIESSAMAYFSYRVTFNVAGKSVSAMFYNENAIVKRK